MPHRPHARAFVPRLIRNRRQVLGPVPVLVLVLSLAGAAAPAWGAVQGDVLNLFTRSGATGAALYQACAVTLGDGRVLRLGGSALSPQGGSDVSVASCELFDPGRGSWSPTGALLTARRACGACLLAGGQVMAAGGYDVSGGMTVVLSAAELYIPASGSWFALPALPTALNAATLIALPSGDVLAVGASAAGPAAGAVFSFGSASWRAIAPTLIPRTACAYALLPSGLVLAAGGDALNGSPGAYTHSATTSLRAL